MVLATQRADLGDGVTAQIVVFGTESTGKTTLARILANRFGAPWASEYVRAFWEQRNGDIKPEDLDIIARGQMANEDAAIARARDLVICDTDLITNTLWADLLFPGHCPDWVRAEAEARRSHRHTLYLLCDTDIDFVGDGQRCFPGPADRAYCRALWRDALVRRQLPFIDIHGPLGSRVEFACLAITRATGLRPQT